MRVLPVVPSIFRNSGGVAAEITGPSDAEPDAGVDIVMVATDASDEQLPASSPTQTSFISTFVWCHPHGGGCASRIETRGRT